MKEELGKVELCDSRGQVSKAHVGCVECIPSRVFPKFIPLDTYLSACIYQLKSMIFNGNIREGLISANREEMHFGK